MSLLLEQDHVIMHGVSWQTFQQLLTDLREDLACGFEPDACFYLDHADAIAPDRPLDLAVDPPPDLVVEVDITRSSLDKFPIYAALGVPEV
jgi:Uma2 family endonuclease